jgi:hypothetical protein
VSREEIPLIDFNEVQQADCMHEVSVHVKDELREHVADLYGRLIQRCDQLEDGMPNVVLAGLTLAWIETVYDVFGSATYESAVSLLRGISPDDKAVRRGMKQATTDLLRRSGWSLKQRKA